MNVRIVRIIFLSQNILASLFFYNALRCIENIYTQSTLK